MYLDIGITYLSWMFQVNCVCVCALCLFDLIDERVYEVFDLWCLGWEQYELLIGQIELQHVLRWDGHKQDVGIAGKKAE